MFKTLALTTTVILGLAISGITLAKRGCCSWHGGANHCDRSSYRIICNDGTYSKSCLCEQNSNNNKFRY